MLKSNLDLRGLLHLGKMSGGYFVTTFINNAIPFLILPILTRFLAPEQFANVALFSFYLALSNAIAGISIPNVIAKHFFDSDKKQIAALIGNSFLVVLAFSLATMVLILVSYSFLQKVFKLSLFWLMVIPLTSFAAITFSTGLSVMRNEKKRLLFSRYQIGNTAINLAISLLLVVVLLRGWQGRVWGIIISYSISAWLIYSYLKAHDYISFAISKKSIKNILSIVVPLIPDSFQSVIISQVGILFMQLYFAKEVLGVYAVGFQIAYAVKLLISTLALSWFPYLYEQLAHKNDINTIYLSRMFLTLVALLSAAVAFINIFSGMILKVMASLRYAGAREFIPWFTIGFFFHGLYVFLMPILIKFEQQRYISIISFTHMLIMILLNACFVGAFGYLGSAYAFSIIHFLMFLAFAWKTQKIFPLPWLRALKIWNWQ